MEREEFYGDLGRAQARVGRFLWHWALLEAELRRALRRALNLSDLEVRILASNVQLRAKIDIIRTVINANGPTEAGQRLDNVLKKIANYSATRNMMAHDLFGPSEDDGEIVEFFLPSKGRASLRCQRFDGRRGNSAMSTKRFSA